MGKGTLTLTGALPMGALHPQSINFRVTKTSLDLVDVDSEASLAENLGD